MEAKNNNENEKQRMFFGSVISVSHEEYTCYLSKAIRVFLTIRRGDVHISILLAKKS